MCKYKNILHLFLKYIHVLYVCVFIHINIHATHIALTQTFDWNGLISHFLYFRNIIFDIFI